MVTALASLWPVVLIVVGGVIAMVFYKQIRKAVDLLLGKLETAESVDLKVGRVGASLTSAAREAAKEAVAEGVAKEEKKEQETESSPAKAAPKIAEQPKTPGESARALLDAMHARNREEVERLHRQMQEGETDELRRLKNDALYLYALFILGDPTALGKLEELSKTHESFADAFWWLGYCYQNAHELAKASDAFRIAAEKETDLLKRANNLVSSAECLFELGKQAEAEEALGNELKSQTNSEAEFVLLSALGSFYERTDQRELRALALDLALRSRPNDSNAMFNTAYSYAEADLEGLALFHYDNLLDFEPDNASALNNIGVQYERLGMPCLSTDAYKQAEKLNNSLASANLANKYMNAGFVEEAKTTLDNGKEMNDVHPNVLTALSSLSEKQKSEGKRGKEILENAVRQQDFLRVFAAKYLIPISEESSFSGEWILENDVHVEVNITGQSIEANWTINGKKHKFDGTVRHAGAKIAFHNMKYGYWSSDAELYFEKEADAFAYLADNDQTIEIMKLKDHKHEFLKLQRTRRESNLESAPADDRQ